MGICVNCKFYSQLKDTVCENENNAELDYVTGRLKLSDCYDKNRFGECSFFEDIKNDEGEPVQPENQEASEGE